VGGGVVAASAVQYLEKIFQVVLTLPPLAAGGYVDLVDSLINPHDETSSPGGGQQLAEAAPTGTASPVTGPPTVAGTQAEDPRGTTS